MQHNKEKELVHRLKYNFKEEVVNDHCKRFYNTHIAVNILREGRRTYVMTVHPILYDDWDRCYNCILEPDLVIDEIVSREKDNAEMLARYIVQYATDVIFNDNGLDYYYMDTQVLFLKRHDFYKKRDNWLDNQRPLVEYSKAITEELDMEGII